MLINGHKFHERTRTVYPCGQILARGMMDMGDYDEACLVEIVGERVTAWVEDKVMEVEL